MGRGGKTQDRNGRLDPADPPPPALEGSMRASVVLEATIKMAT